MSLSQVELDRALEELLAQTCRDAPLRAEFEASRGEFLGPGAVALSAKESELAARRHAEWFLLERPSSALGGVPIELALHRLAGAGDAADDDDALGEQGVRALVASQCGVFEVTGVRPGEGVWIRDLAAWGEYPLEERAGSHALQPGDVLVGRIFPVGDSLYRISHAAGFFRNPELNRALVIDLERARAGHRGVLRFSQAELECMFWSGSPAARVPSAEGADGADTDPIENARAVLCAGGMQDAEIARVLGVLASAPFDPARVVYGVGDPLAAILDRLAFDSSVDLEAARRALIDAWPALSKNAELVDDEPSEATSNGAVDVRAAIDAFDRGRSEGRDLDQLFRDLERSLHLEGERAPTVESADEAEEAALDAPAEDLAPDFPGVVGAMVEEFLWDVEREQGEVHAREHAILRKLSTFGEGIGVFENVGARELLLFTSIWLPERGELRDAAEARSVIAALRAFCAWAEERHEVPLLAAFEASAARLEGSLPRITEANLHRARSGSASAGEVFEVHSPESVVDRHGRAHAVRVDPALSEILEPGDRVRAQLERDGALRVYCCYPPESAALLLGL